MDINGRYTLKGDPSALLDSIRGPVMGQLEELVQAQVNAYLADLEKHMGPISGATGYSDGAISWDALDEDTLKESPKFWFESGKAKRSISVNIKLTANSITAFVGVSEGSEGYQEVLWNELGFTPENGDKLIRRALFVPLAEVHKAELQEKIYSAIGNATFHVEI